jgi:hypothetical protein
MSVIHEALKRVRESRQTPRVSLAWLAKAVRSSWMAWTVTAFAVVLAMTSLYFREFQSGNKSHTKLRLALLELNDARLDRDSLAAKKQEVEYDNFEKEKKISGLTKELHLLEMGKLQLESENKILKKRIAGMLASAVGPSAPSN